MSDRFRLYTDLTISSNGTGNLKKYFNSIKRALPKDWVVLKNEVYKDDDVFYIIDDSYCLRTPYFVDKRVGRQIVGKIFLGLTDSAIILLEIDILPEISKEQSLEILGYINHIFHESILKPNKYYSLFNHNFEFRGPHDENWSKIDIRDSRLIRLHSKADNNVYALAKSSHTKIKDRKISYPDANNISLSLSIMKKSYKNAYSLHQQILRLDKGRNIKIGKGMQTMLYDYFEEIITSVIFAYTSAEAISNAAIPETFTVEKFNEKGVKEIWSKENIERWMSTSYKISEILPDILKTSNIKLEPFWSKFKELEVLRNKIVHQRTIQEGTRLNTEIYDELLQPSVFDKIRSALAIIKFLYDFDNAHPYFPLGLGMAKHQVVDIESMEKHFKVVDE